MKKYISIAALLIVAACTEAQTPPAMQDNVPDKLATQPMTEGEMAPVEMKTKDTAIFAGGCFWCVESDFEKLPGVIKAVSGYTGGRTKNPTYKEVTYKNTGHYEAVKVTFNPSEVSYKELVDFFWMTIDPTDPNGQFCDKGDSYRTAVFARPDQKQAADGSKENIIKTKPFRSDIITPVLPAAKFYDAEKYHQDYYKKNKIRYKYYRNGCGRDKRLKQLWGSE